MKRLAIGTLLVVLLAGCLPNTPKKSSTSSSEAYEVYQNIMEAQEKLDDIYKLDTTVKVMGINVDMPILMDMKSRKMYTDGDVTLLGMDFSVFFDGKYTYTYSKDLTDMNSKEKNGSLSTISEGTTLPRISKADFAKAEKNGSIELKDNQKIIFKKDDKVNYLKSENYEDAEDFTLEVSYSKTYLIKEIDVTSAADGQDVEANIKISKSNISRKKFNSELDEYVEKYEAHSDK